MRTIGRYVGAGRTIDGGLTVTFEIDDDVRALDKLKGYKDADLIIEAKKYYEKKSLDANGYFWALCSEIAKAIGSTRWDVYLWMLKVNGVSFETKVLPEAVKLLKREFRLAEAFEEWPDDDGLIRVRCYVGASHYDKEEFSRLINAAVIEAEKLGIDTWTPGEIAKLVDEWGEKNDTERHGD